MSSISASYGRVIGTSPYITITAESFNITRYHNISGFLFGGIRPPDIAYGNSYSEAMEIWIQLWADWNYCKITEPKYDGIADDMGVISNMPDYIKDFHFIGIMRNIDDFLKPHYNSHIFAEAHSPTPSRPPTGPYV